MKLNKEALQNKTFFKEAGFKLPTFDLESVIEDTNQNPNWIHFGAGNIFRAFTANVQQNILNEGKAQKGIIVVEGFDYEIIEKIYRKHDNLSVLVTLKADGSIEKTVVASITEALELDQDMQEKWQRLVQIFNAPSLQMASFTITEKGYNLTSPQGTYYTNVEEDFLNGPKKVTSYIGKVAALLYARYQAGKTPIAMVSMDNCSHNGTKLYEAIKAFATHWVKNNLVEEGFESYISDPSKVSFPWSMIDKITPRPDLSVKQMLEEVGFEDTELVVTNKNTYVASFVNAEEPEYLVIEDLFPNGRPNLEEGGVIFTDRETVDKVEKMKVCTCLNPLHTTLAIYGCLLGYTLISKEMENPTLKRLVEIIGYDEGLPVVVNPEIIDPKDFIGEVLNKRIPNPFMPDSPQRIATDTSQKLAIRFGETIKAYRASQTLDVNKLQMIPLVLAGWCRYLLGVDDKGEEMSLSSDPLLETLKEKLKDIRLGEVRDFNKDLYPVLSDSKIFGVDLYEVGLGKKVEVYFEELIKGPGAVKETLEKYIQKYDNN